MSNDPNVHLPIDPTLSLEEPTKTEETDTTDSLGTSSPRLVSNSDFLVAVFSTLADSTCPVTVSFEGNPTAPPKHAWRAHPWSDQGLNDIATRTWTSNNYVSLASFVPDDSGNYRRKKNQFAALHAVVLDDVGTKVDVESVLLQPTWMLETSPGNYQVGYILKAPVADGVAADRLMSAIIKAGLCDPGFGGPRCRLARLPVASNGKFNPPFVCCMHEWRPDTRYTMEDLVSGLGLDIGATELLNRHQARRRRAPGVVDEYVSLPRPHENNTLAQLRDRGLYKASLDAGKHDITCPWRSEHTDGVDSGTAYFEPDADHSIGGFKCMHAHCCDRHIRDLLTFLDIEVSQARSTPTIRVVAGGIHRVVDAAEFYLAQDGRHYQRGGLIVTVVHDPATMEARVQDVNPQALVRALASIATWERLDRRSGDWERIDPPERHVKVLYATSKHAHLAPLHSIARQPYLRPDGSLSKEPGYDPATCMYGVFDQREYKVPEAPTKDQAAAALTELGALLDEFCFAGARDKAAALSAILTAAIRPSLPTAPMFHVQAPTPGSGKSYLCALISAFATPQPGVPTSFPTNDTDCSKLLIAALITAPAVLEFDNLTGDLVPYRSLCTVLSSEFWSDRILGVSKTATVMTRTLFLSSGNNVGPVQDMVRRCISIALAPNCEIPAGRSFTRPTLVLDVYKERARLVSLALTVVRGWLVAGRPQAQVKSFAGYADWGQFCRQPLMWLGMDDPIAHLFEAMRADPDQELLARFLHAWYREFGTNPRMIRDVLTRAFATPTLCAELIEVMKDIAEDRGEINRRRLGWWLKRHSGRIVDGLQFGRVRAASSAEKWQVIVSRDASGTPAAAQPMTSRGPSLSPPASPAAASANAASVLSVSSVTSGDREEHATSPHLDSSESDTDDEDAPVDWRV